VTSGDAGGGPPHLIVPVAELRRHLGSRAPVERGLVAEGLALPDVGVAVPDGAEVVLRGEVESISEGVVLTGAVEVPWTGSCRRCLGPVDGVATVDVREVFAVHPTDGETWPLDGDQLDVGPLVHDSALLALPLAPLCTDDCAGPAPDRFPTAPAVDEAATAEADQPPARDPRWAALDDLDL